LTNQINDHLNSSCITLEARDVRPADKKKKFNHIQQVYSSRRTSAIDKFIEQALNRGAGKDDARHSSLL